MLYRDVIKIKFNIMLTPHKSGSLKGRFGLLSPLGVTLVQVSAYVVGKN